MKKIYYILGGIAVIVVATVLVLLTIDMAQPKVQKLGGRSYEVPITLWSASSTAGWSKAIRVDDYRNIVLMPSSTSTASMTYKFAVSNDLASGAECSTVDFTSTALAGNHWDYVEVIDMENGTSIEGDTGYVVSADEVRNFEVNTELSTCFAAQLIYTTGTSTLKLKFGTNQ